MSTKYITIRIPIPTLSWFSKKEEESTEYEFTDLSHRIAEIQGRISSAKRGIELSKRFDKISSPQPKPSVDTTAKTEQPPEVDIRKQRSLELDALKAKLFTKKK